MIHDPTKESSEVKKEVIKAKVYSPSDCRDEMLHDLEFGKQKGSTTHNVKIDQCWTWRKEEFNIWTGYANEGRICRLT